VSDSANRGSGPVNTVNIVNN